MRVHQYWILVRPILSVSHVYTVVFQFLFVFFGQGGIDYTDIYLTARLDLFFFPVRRLILCTATASNLVYCSSTSNKQRESLWES